MEACCTPARRCKAVNNTGKRAKEKQNSWVISKGRWARKKHFSMTGKGEKAEMAPYGRSQPTTRNVIKILEEKDVLSNT